MQMVCNVVKSGPRVSVGSYRLGCHVVSSLDRDSSVGSNWGVTG
jgi:hypothetical protein